MSKYDDEYDELQAALVRYQQHAIEVGERHLIIFEGRDTAGKDGAIKRMTENLSVRNTRIVALPKPTDRERTQWYFQRYAAQLPAAGELVILNRSWYNRGGVEPVMGFCTPKEHETFLNDAPRFEAMLLQSDLKLVKFWLDISRKEQARRLKDRRTDPLKALKISPLDAVAEARWDDYSLARDEMLSRTHSAESPWHIVHTDDKKAARLNVFRHVLRTLAPKAVRGRVAEPDPDVLFPFETAAIADGRLER
jgi:polyphosphate kinase 2